MWLAVTAWLFLKKYWRAGFYWLATGGLAIISGTFINTSFIH